MRPKRPQRRPLRNWPQPTANEALAHDSYRRDNAPMTTTEAPAPPRARRKRKSPALKSAEFAPIATERLTLRPLRPEDAESLHRLVNDWAVSRTLAAVPFPYPRELADEWIASTRSELATGTAWHLAITGEDSGSELLVGVVGLRRLSKSRAGRLGYWVGRRFWGHGVATEAAGKLARWALANLDLDRLEANVATDNPASAAVLRRIGFRESGTGTETFVSRGGDAPVWRFEATRDDLFPGDEPPSPPEPDGTKPLLLVAACALIDSDGRVLLARRPEGKRMAGLWEFPGGKLDPGETPEVGADPRTQGRTRHRRVRRLPRSLRLRLTRLRSLSPAHAALPLPAMEGHSPREGGPDPVMGAP